MIVKLLTKKKLNYAKLLKRAFSISRMENNIVLLNKIVPFLTSNINYGATFITDINVVLDILQNGNSLLNVKKYILIHLKNLINRMKNFDLFDVKKYIIDIKKAISYINNQEKFILILENIKTNLKNIINDLTKNYIGSRDINLNILLP